MGLKFEGYIYIPETATYEFSTIADDGAKLFIDDELIVDNDGRHWIHEAFGATLLEKVFIKSTLSILMPQEVLLYNVLLDKKEKKSKK